jgi:hypothetical protein
MHENTSFAQFFFDCNLYLKILPTAKRSVMMNFECWILDYRTNHLLTQSRRSREAQRRAARFSNRPRAEALAAARANYWFGLQQPIVPDTYRETLHLSPSFTLASLENGHGSQINRIHLTITNSASGPLALTGGPLLVNLTRLPPATLTRP